MKIIFYREKCIGCCSCSDIWPEKWEINDRDGKSDLLGSEIRKNGIQILQTEPDEENICLEVSDCCPVGIIELTS
ncbi:MAG: ferredoxin [Cytophagaceae bacterium]